MSLYPARPTFATVLRSFASADGMPFADVLAGKGARNEWHFHLK